MKRVWAWMCWNARNAKVECESSPRFTHPMRYEKSSTASVCLPVLHQFQRPCPDSPFLSNHSERRRENVAGNVCSQRADYCLKIRRASGTCVL